MVDLPAGQQPGPEPPGSALLTTSSPNDATSSPLRPSGTEQTDALLRYGYVLTGNRHDAADLVQEALVRLCGAWARVRRKDSPHSYVRTTMARLHISVYRVPLSGGAPQPVKGAERHHVLQWPWVGVHRGKAVFRELLNVETGERRDAVVKADEEVRCGVDRCAGVAVRYRTVKAERPRDRSGKEIKCGTRRCPDTARSATILRRFVRDRDGSHERALPITFQQGDDAGLERFFKVTLTGPGDQTVLTLYDVDTGTSADLGVRPDARGVMAIPDGGLDRLMTYPIGNEMYVLDLTAIK
ncbi:sigma factor [Nonomuraea wenchangensis]|uniref:sigma factor n=1 Tax=Nonomuraea wenchangensis TaxID=568860 RepID=UPI0031841663